MRPPEIRDRLRRRIRIAALVIVMLASAAAWLPAIRTGFLSDDLGALARLHRTGSVESVLEDLHGPHWGFPFYRLYRPVGTFSLALDWSIFGADSAGFHGTALLIHALVGGLVFLLLDRFLIPGRTILAAAGAIGFGALAIHAEALHWVFAGRLDLLAALFTLSSLAVVAAALARRSRLLLALSLLPALAAYGSKEMTFTLPGLVFLSGLMRRPRSARLIAEATGAHALLLAFFLLLRAGAVGGGLSPYGSARSPFDLIRSTAATMPAALAAAAGVPLLVASAVAAGAAALRPRQPALLLLLAVAASLSPLLLAGPRGPEPILHTRGFYLPAALFMLALTASLAAHPALRHTAPLLLLGLAVLETPRRAAHAGAFEEASREILRIAESHGKLIRRHGAAASVLRGAPPALRGVHCLNWGLAELFGPPFRDRRTDVMTGGWLATGPTDPFGPPLRPAAAGFADGLLTTAGAPILDLTAPGFGRGPLPPRTFRSDGAAFVLEDEIPGREIPCIDVPLRRRPEAITIRWRGVLPGGGEAGRTHDIDGSDLPDGPTTARIPLLDVDVAPVLVFRSVTVAVTPRDAASGAPFVPRDGLPAARILEPPSGSVLRPADLHRTFRLELPPGTGALRVVCALPSGVLTARVPSRDFTLAGVEAALGIPAIRAFAVADWIRGGRTVLILVEALRSAAEPWSILARTDLSPYALDLR